MTCAAQCACVVGHPRVVVTSLTEVAFQDVASVVVEQKSGSGECVELRPL